MSSDTKITVIDCIYPNTGNHGVVFGKDPATVVAGRILHRNYNIKVIDCEYCGTATQDIDSCENCGAGR